MDELIANTTCPPLATPLPASARAQSGATLPLPGPEKNDDDADDDDRISQDVSTTMMKLPANEMPARTMKQQCVHSTRQ